MWRRFFALLLLILIILAVRGAWRVAQKSSEAEELRVESQARLSELQKREQELRTDIAGLRSERGIEAELRERYDLAAEGEGVVVIVEAPSPGPQPAPTRLERFKSWLWW
jgi:cell division protein FtsB